MGWGCGRMGIGIGGVWTGKMRSHCGMEGGGGGNVVPVRGQHEGKGSVLPGRVRTTFIVSRLTVWLSELETRSCRRSHRGRD